MQTLMPDIESGIPLPSRSVKDIPEMSPHDEIKLRATTIKILADLQGRSIVPTEDEQVDAETLAHHMVTNPDSRPEFAKYKDETMAYLAGMIEQSNVMLVNELSDFKMYVINKLVYEVETAKNPKDRIAALSKLGDIDGVDAFKKRTETTITIKSMEEVEKELLSVLDNIEYAIVPPSGYVGYVQDVEDMEEGDEDEEEIKEDVNDE